MADLLFEHVICFVLEFRGGQEEFSLTVLEDVADLGAGESLRQRQGDGIMSQNREKGH